MSAVESRDWIGHRKERTVRERRGLTEVEKKSRTIEASHRDINPARPFRFPEIKAWQPRRYWAP